MSKPFSPSQFTATKFDTAEQKAKAANDLASFVERGMPAKGWRKGIYHTLEGHMFGHIAHYNMFGFFDTWFRTPEQRADWIRYALGGGVYGVNGSPAHTWCDVEQAFIEWLSGTDLPDRFAREASDTVEARERAQLAALEAKYR